MAKKLLSKRILPDGGKLFVSEDGAAACQMHHLENGVTLHTCKGTIGVEFAAEVIADGNQQLLQHGRCIYMVDCWDSPRMTGEFRDAVVEWMLDALRRYDGKLEAHLLIRSAVTSMVVGIANMVLRRKSVKTYSSIPDWTNAGKTHLPLFRRRPIP